MDKTVATETVVGSHVLTIDGYTKTIAALAVGESIQSEPFSVGGHCWIIRCCPRGVYEGVADWVSVDLYTTVDHHRAINHQVKASYKFVLLDGAGVEILSRGSAEPETFSIAHGRAAWGDDQFIERKTLESYLIIQDDDCCRIRCDVAVVKEQDPSAVPLPSPERRLGHLLLASEVGRDVTFVVGGEQFTAHKCVLDARSSTAFMAEVLLGTGKESGGSLHVRVDGISPRAFQALLHFIYTESVADHGIALDLLEVARRYGMERLKMICADLLCSDINASTALHTLMRAKRHRCLKLNQACVKFIRGMLDAFKLEETE